MAKVAEAKRLEKLENELVQKFKAAEREERSTSTPTASAISRHSIEQPNPIQSSSKGPKRLTVNEAKRLEALNDNLKNAFSTIHEQEMLEMRERQKKYEPITKAISEQKEKDAQDRLRLRTRQLMRIQSRSDTPVRREAILQTTTDRLESPPAEINQSVKRLLDTKQIKLGLIASKYLPRARDATFGIVFEDISGQFKIGAESITFNNDDIVFTNDQKPYKGTEGLWRLLTINDKIDKDQYTEDDWNTYKDILIRTHSLYRNNDPNSKWPKANPGRKWKHMIKQIWEEDIKSDNPDEVVGSGLALYNSRQVEYKYINNLNELIKRLNYIYAQEMAGNNNFHNEKLSLVKFIHDRMEELVETPRGTKYLVRCLSALPESVIEGSGLLNEIINKLPFELHAPRNWAFDTYNFCGPGTQLDKRLARGDKGINPLDDACKQHDVWYSKHKNAEDRWEADKVLQKKAWDRVTSSDADLNERAVGLATTGTMWLKRKLGMGLGTSGFVYYK